MSEPEVIKLVISQRTHKVYACGSRRAELSLITSRKWHWRVWEVWGPQTLASGIILGLRQAMREAFRHLSPQHSNGMKVRK